MEEVGSRPTGSCLRRLKNPLKTVIGVSPVSWKKADDNVYMINPVSCVVVVYPLP